MNATTHEEWRPVVGYEDRYEVSDQGRIRSLDRHVYHPTRDCYQFVQGQIISPDITRQGYFRVRLCRDGEQKRYQLHHLIAEAFFGPRPDGLVVCHYNDVRTDNRLSNLRYATQSENMHDRVRNNPAKTHCAQGHEFTPENTYRHWNKKLQKRIRVCRECSQIRMRKRRAA